MVRPQELPRGQLNAAHVSVLLGPDALQPLGHTNDANLGHVPLQQGVGGLGGAVGDEHYVRRVDMVLGKHPANGLNNTVRHPPLRVVGGGDLHLGDHLAGGVVNRHRIGEGAAHVNSNAYLCAHSRHSFLFLLVY